MGLVKRIVEIQIHNSPCSHMPSLVRPKNSKVFLPDNIANFTWSITALISLPNSDPDPISALLRQLFARAGGWHLFT